MPRIRLFVLALPSLALAALIASGAGCSSSPADSTGTGGSGGTGASAGSAGAGGTGGSGGSVSDCDQAKTILDVSKAPGAGPGYAAPSVSGHCTDTMFVVESNGIPHYTFVQITPNPLQAQNFHWEIPRNPAPAAATTKVPLLGLAGFAVNGLPFFGPNEAAQPAEEAWGDPIYNGIMDACLGHTSDQYHYHSMLVKCLTASGLVAEPWMNADPPADEESPIIGWAMDGYPIKGPQECADAACGSVVEMKSGYDMIGNPKTNAWDAYAWNAHPGDATYLDECNGHTGPKGDYHYHATEGFPYIIGCYHGTPGGTQQGGPDGGTMDDGGMMGPKTCTSPADCNGACPQGSIGCTCANSPMGMICVPTCNTTADCPMGPMGMQLVCNNGVCTP